jgi:hypothetical protein
MADLALQYFYMISALQGRYCTSQSRRLSPFLILVDLLPCIITEGHPLRQNAWTFVLAYEGARFL